MISLATVIKVALEILQWLIVARVLLSFIPHNPRHPVLIFIYDMTEPILGFFRRLLPATSLPLDFSPLVAILVIQLLEHFIS
ncbi:YggT family protein [Thermanaeromonas toyohensis ToBE]|uniref:YggT family protein n=1 Tax=Thermanaeromonas toyohensis ToBE TaxID=698762 RepID=A0A1W1VMZ9_9FIRM|nr:YggT family protein [Thermanaeromonas toyohensis]SMB94431.1 YggT family protein [Thermanaeromonas toyohensis ToBE]